MQLKMSNASLNAEVEEEICAVCPKMTYQQRIGGCVTFMLLGFMLSLGSLTRCATYFSNHYYYHDVGRKSHVQFRFVYILHFVFRLFQLLLGNPVPFATMYSLGNIISLCSTCFLYGPWTQAKKMFAPTR